MDRWDGHRFALDDMIDVSPGKGGSEKPGAAFLRMYDLAIAALDTAKIRGASYADVRVMHLRQRDLTTKNGQVGTLAQSESIGLGIRVLANGAWGFASTDRLTRDGVAACAAQAGSIPKAAALAKSEGAKVAPENADVH